MWVLRASLFACLALGGCAAPLVEMAAPGLMPKPADMMGQLSKGFGTQFPFLPGTTAATPAQEASK